MNVVVIPFFLAALIAVDKPWQHGPEYVFHVQVNSTAIPEDGTYGSVRLNLESRLVCQPRSSHTLSCRFDGSMANSFVTDSLDPSEPAAPAGQVNRQEAYEVNEERFEIKFNEKGLDSLVVNENIQPRELDMIRMIVGQLNIGANFEGTTPRNDETFEMMENFTQGECMTIFKIDKRIMSRMYAKRGFALRPVFGLKDGKLVQIQKIRNPYMCTHKVPYFFGSAESFKEVSDIESEVSLLDSYIIVTSTEFISGMSNVITTNKVSEAAITTLYENVRLMLESIRPAEGEPPPVRDPESVSIFIGRWFGNSFEGDN